MYNILIVEDDSNIAKYIQTCLTMGGYESIICDDGTEAIELAGRQSFDLILLDIMLPGADGFEVMEHIRTYGTPVIFLTAMEDVADKVKGLKLGAEDYIVKPFEVLEFLARLEVALRRNHRADDNVRRYGAILVDEEKHQVLKDGVPVPLTPKEFEVFLYFLGHPDMVISRSRLLSHIWGYDFEGETRTVDTHVQQVRKKLELGGRLLTVPKFGYKLLGEDTQA